MAREVEYKGEKHSIYEWSRISGISYQTLCTRYDRGDRGEELFRENNTVKCKICGKEFTTDSYIKKCCSEECVKKNAKINVKAYNEKQKAMRTAKPKKKEKKLTVTDIAVKAREAGMSYGQYTAMMYMQEGKVQQ